MIQRLVHEKHRKLLQ